MRLGFFFKATAYYGQHFHVDADAQFQDHGEHPMYTTPHPSKKPSYIL